MTTMMPIRTLNEFKPLSALEYLRVTGVQVFERCPYTWALQFLTASSDGEGRSSASAGIGTAVHSIIEGVVRTMRGEEVPDTSAAWMKVPEHEHEALLAYINDMVGWKIAEVMAVEHEFQLDVPGVGVPVRGHIDLVLRMQDGSIAVVDHKTNRDYDDVGYWRAQMQPLLYAWAVRRLWPGARPVHFRIGYVNVGRPVDWVTDPEEDEHVEERMRANWRNMASYDRAGVWPMSVNEHCKWCPVSTVCPEHQGAIDRFKLQLESKFSLAKPGEKLAFVNAVIKAAQAQKDVLEAMIRAEVKDAVGGSVVHGDTEYSLTVPHERKLDARVAVQAFLRWAETADRDQVDAAVAMLPDLLTAKVGGVDKIDKTLPVLAFELSKHVRVEDGSPRLKARPLSPLERAPSKQIGGR